MKCPNCGTENAKNVKYCGQCGGRMDLEVVDIQCSMCGFVNQPKTKFCGGCGNVLALSMTKDRPSAIGSNVPSHPQRIRTGYVIGGGVVAAIFFGLFYWATTYTWTDRVWHEIYGGIGYYETVENSVDPAIQALLLMIAIVGLIGMVFGIASKK